MNRKKRATLIYKLVLALLILGLGILFIAASVMAHIYDSPERQDDAGVQALSVPNCFL
jgi:hypothetical protein